MSLGIHLLGKPRLERYGEPAPSPRGRKAWGLLAYLALSRVRNPSRERLAELLFVGADDPLGSLRWNLAELRRRVGASALPQGSTELALPPDAFLDVDALERGTPQEAVAIPGLGRELLDGMDFGSSPAFETWLLSERSRLVGAAGAALHEAALDRLAAGEAAAAVALATRLVELNPYEENFQELLVRGYAEAGHRAAAHRQLSICVELFRSELGRDPSASLLRAAEATAPTPVPASGAVGAHDRALTHLRHSVQLAERAGSRQQAAFSLSFVGRSHFLREEIEDARVALERSFALARETKWLAFEPWPESWLTDAELAGGELGAGRERFEHAWALACELGDPCWEGAAGQGLGRIACLGGEVPRGLRLLEEARRRAGSLPDAYVWVQAYALAELASAAVEAGHRHAREWVEDLSALAARTGMREFGVRACLLRATLGDRRSLDSAAALVGEVENPALRERVQGLRATVAA